MMLSYILPIELLRTFSINESNLLKNSFSVKYLTRPMKKIIFYFYKGRKIRKEPLNLWDKDIRLKLIIIRFYMVQVSIIF